MHTAKRIQMRANKAPNRIQKAVRRARCFAKSSQVIDRKKKEMAVRYFSKADKNSDGRLEETELLELYNTLCGSKFRDLAALEARVRQLFEEFDLDGDGGLDEEEFMGLYNQLMMDSLDWEDLAAQISDSVVEVMTGAVSGDGSETARAYERQLDGDTAAATSTLTPKLDRAQRALSRQRVFAALSQCDREQVKYFLEDGVDVNLQDTAGKTMLHIAVEQDNADLVELILMYGPNLEAVDSRCLTALDLSCASWIGNMHKPCLEGDRPCYKTPGASQCTQLLKDAGACHSLHVSAWCGDDARVRVCIEKLGIDPNSHNCENETALHMAAKSGHFDTTMLLLHNGADKSMSSPQGSPLSIAQAAAAAGVPNAELIVHALKMEALTGDQQEELDAEMEEMLSPKSYKDTRRRLSVLGCEGFIDVDPELEQESSNAII